MLLTIADVMAAAAGGKSPRFFARDTMRYWESRVAGEVTPDGGGGAYFVTSETTGFKDPAREGERWWTLRHCRPDGEIRAVSGFGEYAAEADALVAMRLRRGVARDEEVG